MGAASAVRAASVAPASSGAWPEAPAHLEVSLAAPLPATIRIPRIGVEANVTELGMDATGRWQVPEEGVGWYWFTGVPGRPGNGVLAGHFDTWWGGQGIFARRHEVGAGDHVVVEAIPRAGDGSMGTPFTVRYVVTASRVVDRDDVALTAPTEDERVTLVTCAGWWSFTQNDYTQRRVVTAVRAD